MKQIIFSTIALTILCAPFVGAQTAMPDSKHSLMANVGIGLGNAYSTASDIKNLETDKSSSTSFGVDYRYRFWKRDNLSLGINVGLAYSSGSMTLKGNDISFNYAAGADADMDGDAYQRYTTITDVSQKVTLGEFVVPVYVDLNLQLSRRFSVYAEAGLGFRVSTTTKAKDVSGKCDVYGIYPKYGNLKIDDEWLNDFGDHSLAGASSDPAAKNAFTVSLRAGAGVRVRIYGPLSVECGVNYNYGLMNRLKSGAYAEDKVTADNAPMTYTVEDGRKVKALTSALGKSKLSNLNLNVGLIFNF